ncbi:MFS transporter [Candidatus Woesearchaeota archaeon]|nr:MFS transporter [Candidatus Woesearchaeota archaeon]
MHKQLRLFLTANSFFALAAGMLGPIYALFVKQIGGDVLAASGAWATFMIVSGLGIFLMGKIQDKIKREKPVIIIGYFLQSLGFLGYFFVSNIVQLFIVQVILGVSLMIQIPVFNSFYTKYLEKGKYASQWAAWEGLYFTITGIAALIGGFVVKFFDFKFLFLMMFGLSLIGLALSTQLKEEK